MSTVQTWQIESTSLDNTLLLAEQIGSKIRGGEVFALISDLGGGKTAFVKGLSKGMGSQDVVHSPSFTLSNQYKAGELTLHHYDFYRLPEAGIMRQDLAEVLNDPQAVTAVEWGGIVADVLPENHVIINIQPTSDLTRRLTFEYPASYSYLFAKGEQKE